MSDDNDHNKKLYFTFDVSSKTLWDMLLPELMPDGWIKYLESGLSVVSTPMIDVFSYTGEIKPLPYMGDSQYHKMFWKPKSFIKDSIQTDYNNHLKTHSAHLIQQPDYYKGLFDILN